MGAGEKNPRAKLSRLQVLEIRRSYQEDGTDVAKLARTYGVSRTAIERILSGKSWKVVTDGVDLFNHVGDKRVNRQRALSWEQVQLLRRVAPYSPLTQRQWAKLLGISQRAVAAILHSETYQRETSYGR